MRYLKNFKSSIILVLVFSYLPAYSFVSQKDEYKRLREEMVQKQLVKRGINDPSVLKAMRTVPRHLFVLKDYRHLAYADHPLPIEARQTISQPYIVAIMTQSIDIKKSDKVLEIGTGSGYQAAVLSKIAGRVYSVERIPTLARRARKILDSIGCGTVNIKVTDGSFGWEEMAPFDAILVTAGAPEIPATYLKQLVVGGRLVIPVGSRGLQVLKRIIRTGEEDFSEEILVDCRFVPLIGKLGWNDEDC